MSEHQEFEQKVVRILSDIGVDRLLYNMDEEWRYHVLYSFIENYAYERELINTAIALPVARAFHDGSYRGIFQEPGKEDVSMPYINHCLTVCRMLIDLPIFLDDEEEDILLSSAICHDLIGQGLGEEREHELMSIYHLDKKVFDTVKLVTGRDYRAEEEHKLFFDHILEVENKLAMLVKLADCSCIMSQLYDASILTAKDYIYQTRMIYIPMCVKVKEMYPELIEAANIMMEKMRSLSEATKVLVERYENREIELNHELLELRDENIRIRRAILEYRK